MPPTWKYERAGILLLACPIVCAFDRACMHSLCKRSISITVYLMKFNMRSLMKHEETSWKWRGGLTYCFWCGSRGLELRLATWRAPSSCTPGFSIKRIFPEYWPRGPGTHRTLLQYPHGPVPEHCLALPLCTAAGGSRHKSTVPIYPLGLDKTNFPRIPENIFILSSGRN